MYSNSFVFITVLIYKVTGCNEYEYNIDIKLIPFEIYLNLQKTTHLES